MSKQDNVTGNLHQLSNEKRTKVEPPKTWALKLAIDHGRSRAVYFQKADANTPLVRIVDVLADFADCHGLPAGAAIDEFLAAVDSSLLAAIYTLNENHFASLLDAGHMYGFDTRAVAEAQSMRLYGVNDGGSPYPWAASPPEALKQHIQDHGPQRSDRSLYAVSHATANRLWGWGAVVAAQAETQAAPAMEAPKLSGWAEVVAIKKANKDACLTLVQKRAFAAEFARREASGATGIAQDMAVELGISVTAFNKLKQAKPSKREAKQMAKQEAERSGITTVVDWKKVV